MLIPEDRLLSESHYPIQIALFTEAKDFIWRLRRLSNELGWGDDAVVVSSWAYLYNKHCIDRYDGFRLTMVDDYSVIISAADMYYYMRIAAEMHIERHPENAPELQGILAHYREHFGLDESGNSPHA